MQHRVRHDDSDRHVHIGRRLRAKQDGRAQRRRRVKGTSGECIEHEEPERNGTGADGAGDHAVGKQRPVS